MCLWRSDDRTFYPMGDKDAFVGQASDDPELFVAGAVLPQACCEDVDLSEADVRPTTG